MTKLTQRLSLMVTLAFMISCGQDNEPSGPSINVSDQSFEIEEHPVTGALIGMLSAISADGGTLSYEITDQSVAGALSIDANSGVLSVADSSAFDYEEDDELTADIKVSSGELFSEVTVTINIKDLLLPSSGLVGYWPFDGSAEDAAGDADGDVGEGVVTSMDRHGESNKAYLFSDNGQFIGIGDQDYFQGTDNAFSITLWIDPQQGSSTNSVLLSKVSQQGTTGCGEFHEEFFMGIKDSGFRAIYYQDTEEQTDRRYRQVITPSFLNYQSPNEHGWLHFALTYDGSDDTNNGLNRIKIYIDGVLQTSIAANDQAGQIPELIVDTESHVGIGNNLSSSGEVCVDRAFRGSIDDVAIYNRVLTAEEIALVADDEY